MYSHAEEKVGAPTPLAKAKGKAKATAKNETKPKPEKNKKDEPDVAAPGTGETKSAKRRAKLYARWQKTATGAPAIEASRPARPDPTVYAATVNADQVSASVLLALKTL